MTEAGTRLWPLLRSRQPAGCKFRRQHPLGPFILDFARIAARLALEADGGQHLDNAADSRRTQWLEQQGRRVLRVWNNDILSNADGVTDTLLRTFTPPPPPERQFSQQKHPSPACGTGRGPAARLGG